MIGKDITVLDRSDLEENVDDSLLKAAGSKRVGLLVCGDPLISTTHVQIRLRAKELGIETCVVHNASIYSAASVSGLQNYKFGRSASIPFPEDDYVAKSPYDVIKENKSRGLHTLLFLDIKVGDKGVMRLMTANKAMDVLLDIEEKEKMDVITPDTLCVVLGNVGSSNYVLRAGKIGDLRILDFGPVPHSLIVLGSLHFMEEDYLREFGEFGVSRG